MLKYFLKFMALGLISQVAFAMPNTSTVRSLLNQGVPNGFASRLGTQVVDHKVQLVKARYRFAKLGGASVVAPSILLGSLLDEDNTAAAIPLKSIIKQVLVDVLVPPVASGSVGFTAPFMAVGINTSNDLVPFTAVASLTGKVAGTPVNTAATMVKTVANSTVKVYMKGGSITSGDFNVFIEYYLSD